MPSSLLRATLEHWRDYGAGETALAAISRVLTVSAGAVLRRRTRPSLQEMYSASRAVHLDPEAVVRDFLDRPGAPSLETIAREFTDVTERLRDAYARVDLPYPTDHQLGDGSAFVIYALVRGLAPGLILETGIANGHSTFVILRALELNGAGRLVSIDVNDVSTGGLVARMDLSRWDKRILDVTRRRRSFERIVSTLDGIDLFLHDSDHAYRWQRLEFATVRSHMSPSAVMASDDVDASFAFIEFCEQLGRRPTLLLERRKMFGLIEAGE